jgi:hypothetical protein
MSCRCRRLKCHCTWWSLRGIGRRVLLVMVERSTVTVIHVRGWGCYADVPSPLRAVNALGAFDAARSISPATTVWLWWHNHTIAEPIHHLRKIPRYFVLRWFVLFIRVRMYIIRSCNLGDMLVLRWTYFWYWCQVASLARSDWCIAHFKERVIGENSRGLSMAVLYHSLHDSLCQSGLRVIVNMPTYASSRCCWPEDLLFLQMVDSSFSCPWMIRKLCLRRRTDARTYNDDIAMR